MQAAKAINGSFLICSTSETASLLQSAYSDYQIGAFENFHQLVEDRLVVLGPRLKVFFQYELRFANRIHRFLLIKQIAALRRRMKNQATILGISPLFRDLSHQFLFQYGTRARTPRRCLARRCDQGERRWTVA
jgi:hypothetical protein